jgi:uncharacterized integral membrane protein
MSSSKQQPVVPTNQQTPWLTRAWVGVVLVPVFLFFAFAVGEGLYSMFGYDAGTTDAPLWVVVLVSLLVIAVIAIPCALAIHYGQRAVRAGDHRGRIPLVIGWVVGLGAVALTIVSEVGNVLRG